MEQRLIPSPNPTQKTLLHIRNKPMNNFQDFVLKLAQAHPNAPLAPAAETLLRDRLDRFVSDYRTPDHPPYSAMIEKALQELNEKGGSSKKAISQYLEKRYDNLPGAHAVLLKHHLEESCESGVIVVTRTKKYRLANVSTKVKSKPRRRKWRWECERQKHDKLKIRLIRKRNKQSGKKVEAIKKYQVRDEKEQPLTENGVHGDDQTRSLVTFVDGEKSFHSSPTILHNEPPGMIVAANEKKYTEEVRSQQENGSSAIAKADISAAHTPEHQENEQSEHNQPQLSTPERPPGLELFSVENSHQFGSTEPASAAGEATVTSELVSLPRAGEFDSLQSNCNMETTPNQQQTLDSIPITLKQMHHHEKQPTKEDDVEVAQSVKNDTEIMRNGRRGSRRNNKQKKSETTGELALLQNEHVFEPYKFVDSSNLPLTSNESELALSTEQDPQELLPQPPSQQEDISQGKQLCRSLRACPAKPIVAKDANNVAALPPERVPEVRPVTVCRHQSTQLKQRPRSWPPPKKMKATTSVGKMQDSPKSQKKRILLKRKPDAVAVENLKVVVDCREQDLEQSRNLAECTSMQEKMEPYRLMHIEKMDNSKLPLLKVRKEQRLGTPPTRRSARLVKQR